MATTNMFTSSHAVSKTRFLWSFILFASLVLCFKAFLYKTGHVEPSFASVLSTSRDAKPIPVLSHREELGDLLESEGFTIGLEIGVQSGSFSKIILSSWKQCEKYYLVDIWKHQANYVDGANVEDSQQEKLYESTKSNLKQWAGKTVFYRMFSSDAVDRFENESLDFIYIDARHDYCGAKEDIELYWPKLRRGGIMAGHDYKTAEEVAKIYPAKDYGLCQDGTRNDGSVKLAVNEFSELLELQVSITYKDSWPTWIIRKPSN